MRFTWLEGDGTLNCTRHDTYPLTLVHEFKVVPLTVDVALPNVTYKYVPTHDP